MNRMAEGTVWTAGGCKSWYLDAHGNASTIWPDFTFRFRARTKRFDTGDYELIPRTTPNTGDPTPATATSTNSTRTDRALANSTPATSTSMPATTTEEALTP
jgi:hypothetical protein